MNLRKVHFKAEELKLKKPFAAFLGILSMKYCSVVPKESVTGVMDNALLASRYGDTVVTEIKKIKKFYAY